MLVVGAAAAGLFAACSSDQASRNRGAGSSTGPGAGGANTTTGLLTGPGAGGSINPTTGAGGGGGTGQPPLIPCDPPGMPCPMGQICVKAPMGMAGGVCSKDGGPCNPAMDMCQNDTYCCGVGCRIDGSNDPVCVSGGTRPVNTTCNTKAAIGVFTPVLHCQWPPCKPDVNADAGTDLGCTIVRPTTQPNKIQVLVTPLVADMPTKRDPAGPTASNIIIVTSDAKTGAQQGDSSGGLIRILNGYTCAEEYAITAGPPIRDAATPAIADLDNDGTMEIVARENFPNNNKIVAFKWNGSAFAVMWEATGAANTDPGAWDGISIHDLNDDGFPEVIARYGEVFDGRNGNRLAAGGGPVILESDPVLGDVDGDGKVELVANQVFTWNGTGWAMKYPGLNATTRAAAVSFYAFADFGTRAANGMFDPTKKDGIAEVVAVGAHLAPTMAINEQTGSVGIYTLQGEALLHVEFPAGPTCLSGQVTGERGGPPTVGDFDGDGMPELATAGAYAYRVFDLDCKNAGSGCQDPNNFVRWAQPSQDCSSGATGSTIFDFEGDGKAEAIYADECFVRVYDGKTGEVLFSQAHSTATWWEQNIIADTDHSDRSKLVFSNAATSNVFGTCYNGMVNRSPAITTDPRMNGMVDKIFKGLRCATNEDCPSMKCDAGFCRCTVHTSGPPDIECGNTYNPPLTSNSNDAETGFVCTTPLPGTLGTGNVCRMQHGNVTQQAEGDKYFTGIRVYKDKLDRWASSRAMWNQHAYSITNINDDGKVPKTSAWAQNFKDPKLDNYRQNRQGSTSNDLADITGALDAGDACRLDKDMKVTFTGHICNRGLRGVGASMPATFYLGGGDAGPLGAPVCGPVETAGPVPVGQCVAISCLAPAANVPPGATITMIVNDAGGGAPGSNRIVDECNYINNTATLTIEKCIDPPK